MNYNNVSEFIKYQFEIGKYSTPDLYLLLDISINTSIGRQRKENVGKEWTQLKFLEKLNDFYSEEFYSLVKTAVTVVINTDCPMQKVTAQAIEAINKHDNE